MFATLSRFRRRIAVLTALAMVASVLVAVPAVAADPKADYKAAFDACGTAPSAGFDDVPSGNANAGDIDCIAYYGITKGTSATTYSPVMSVTREHMALFLTRLAGLVGIEMASDPDDAGFNDIGDLSAESQTAINQLADLGITKGTSTTTYSPSDAVTRGQMALFIARLMDKMKPMTDGKDSDGDYGYTPSDVVDNDQDKKIGSPFNDLGSVTKDTYDAITNLYELGVAMGIADTAYGPSASITRASMAGFMASVLDHSNARPAGVSIQASPTMSYGPVGSATGQTAATVMISVRDDGFMPVVDQAVDHFNSEADSGGLNAKGNCVSDDVEGNCEWDSNDELTNSNGNLVLDAVAVTEGETKVFYAWIGDKEGAKFDKDDVTYASASITAMKDEEALKAGSDINEEATDNKVDLDKVSTVTVTAQLVDTENDSDDGPAENAKPVARSGQKIHVGITQTTDPDADGTTSGATATGVSVFSSTRVATLTTDDKGMVSYTVEGPKDDDDKNDVQIGDDQNGTPATAVSGLENRTDVITFTYDDDNMGSPTVKTVMFTIRWSEENSVTAKAKATADPYVVREADGDARVSATVTFYDQYGNGYRQGNGQKVGIEFGTGETDSGGTAIDPVAAVRGNGKANRGTTLESQAAGTPIAVVYTEDPTETPDIDIPSGVEDDLDGPYSIQVVVLADTDNTGSKRVHTLYADENKFSVEGPDVGTNAQLLYSYDSGDVFIMGGNTITLDKFEDNLANQPPGTANDAVVDVVRYAPNGESIFKVTQDSDPNN